MSDEFKIGDKVSGERAIWSPGQAEVGVIREISMGSGFRTYFKVRTPTGGDWDFISEDLTMIERGDKEPRIGDRVTGFAGPLKVRGILVEKPKYTASCYPHYIEEKETGLRFGVLSVKHLVRVKAGSRKINEKSFRWKYGAMAIRLLDGVAA